MSENNDSVNENTSSIEGKIEGFYGEMFDNSKGSLAGGAIAGAVGAIMFFVGISAGSNAVKAFFKKD